MMCMKKLSVLINAYACNPKWGSEPGMGWNWIINIAKYCEVYAITEGEWQREIEEAVALLPQRDNLHFFYLPVSDRIRKMCWNQGDWRFYYYYRKWQKRAFLKALEIIDHYPIDLIHQLNMVGFREPGYLYKIKDKPFIWGPIGGMNNFPENYLQGAQLKFVLFTKLKNAINLYQIKHLKRVREAVKRADCLIAAVPSVQYYLKEIYGRDSLLISETGCSLGGMVEFDERDRFLNSECFNIVWVGQLYFRKQFLLALKTIALLKAYKNIRLHIVTPASEKEMSVYKREARNLGILNLCVWHGKLPHDAVGKLMRQSQLFFFTSVVEETSTVILEAVENALPILCFNTCGFGVVVDDSIGCKIELSTPNRSVFEFAECIRFLMENPAKLISMSKDCLSRSKMLSWKTKMEFLVKEYGKVLISKKHE